MNKMLLIIFLSLISFTLTVHSTTNTPLICSVAPPTFTPPDGGGDNICQPPADVSDFILIIAENEPTGVFIIPAKTTVTGDYYVIGDVYIEQGTGGTKTTLNGNLYATGNINLGNNSQITGWAYTENGVIYSNNGNNIEIIEGTCECGNPIPLIPVYRGNDRIIKRMQTFN